MVLLAVGVGASAGDARAQELRASAVLVNPAHQLLRRPAGWGLSLELLDTRKVGLRIYTEQLDDAYDSSGSLCVGFIQPGRDCSAEPLRESSFLKSWGLQLPVLVHDAGRWRASAVPGARLTELGNARRPRNGSGGLSKEKRMWGVDIGAEASVQPLAGWPLWLSAGAAIGRMYPTTEEVEIDGYTPFEDPINWYGVSLSAGVTW